MRCAIVMPSLHSPYGSSLVVMPISSDVFGTLLSTAGTCSGCSASCCFLRKYFLQSSSAKTQHQAISVLLCCRGPLQPLQQEISLFYTSGILDSKTLLGFLVPICSPVSLEFTQHLLEPLDAASTISSSRDK